MLVAQAEEDWRLVEADGMATKTQFDFLSLTQFDHYDDDQWHDCGLK